MGSSMPDSQESREKVSEAIKGCMEVLAEHDCTVGESLIVAESIREALEVEIRA